MYWKVVEKTMRCVVDITPSEWLHQKLLKEGVFSTFLYSNMQTLTKKAATK